jgi:AcrR family transcriptional regulator
MLPSPPPKQYHQHRANQRERILDAAERLFILKGIDGVSLSAIVREARITRATLYEYFPNKQEVAWAILQRIFELGRVGAAEQVQGSGFQRLEQFMLGMAGRVETAPEHMRFLVEFNTLYAREASAERMRQVTGRSPAPGEDPVARLVRQGLSDGSLRASLDPELIAAAVWNLLSGMNSRFALLGEQVAQEYNRPVAVIYQEICRAFLRGIQPPSSEKETSDAER